MFPEDLHINRKPLMCTNNTVKHMCPVTLRLAENQKITINLVNAMQTLLPVLAHRTHGITKASTNTIQMSSSHMAQPITLLHQWHENNTRNA